MAKAYKIAGLTALFSLACLLVSTQLHSQARRKNILFNQLNSDQGLSDNYIYDMCIDRNGNLWVATGDGLNMFNGKKVTRFFRQDNPELRSDNYREILCDDQNRVWAISSAGDVTLIDKNRRFHRVSLYQNGTALRIRWILYTKNQGTMLLTSAGIYSYQAGEKILSRDSVAISDFSKIEVAGLDTMTAKGFLQIDRYDDNSYIITKDYGFYRVDFKERTIGKIFPMAKLDMFPKWADGELPAWDYKQSKLISINLFTNAISLPLEGITDQFGKPLTERVVNTGRINDEEVALATFKDGLYIFNKKTKELYHYTHEAADPTSIVNNHPNIITTDSTGWVFIGATPNGVSYFKSNAVIGQQTVFMDKKGNGYDGFIINLLSKDDDTYYLGADNALLEWKRSTNETKFYDLGTLSHGKAQTQQAVVRLCYDQSNRLWAATDLPNIFVLDQNKNVVKHLTNDTAVKNCIPSGIIWDMRLQPDGYIWVCSSHGMYRINTTTFEVDRFKQHPLSKVRTNICTFSFFTDPDNAWIGTYGKGLWHYQVSSQKLDSFTTANSKLTSNDVICLDKDSLGNLYVGQPTGLFILFPNGKTKVITDKDGLLSNRVEILMLDKRNRMWMGNDVALSCFDIKDSSLRVFDEQYGLSVQGFRIGAYYQNKQGEMFWGTEKGLQYFYPDDLYNYKPELKVSIDRIETRDIISNLTQSNVYHLSPTDNFVTFYFNAVEYLTQLKTFYEYKLDGIDKNWIKVVNEDFVRYSSLPPGTYVFHVRASNDNKHWEDSGNEVTIVIAAPFYKTWWFKLLGIAVSISLLWLVFKYYRRKNLETREELETQVVINYFASRINSYQKTDEIVWDVAHNCISKLNFEDCVIYLLDEDRNVLVQKAAHGPKMARDFTIQSPIEIPVGKGIVGSVAKTGKPELIGNTELDDRYIVDDVRRYSEVAVPLIIDDKVIGVIDSEHSRKNFFTKKHLNILSTIAVLCSNQLQRAWAEEEKQQAKIEALENKQKVTESRLQSLRLQMNPHFLFNALNSIQQMILANEEMVATKYLSKFSRLLRTILVHSDSEFVSLKEELEILRLYIELESIRFKDSFKYQVDCDEEIDADEIKLPTLLVQPFVENAIWHGLMHKEGDRFLRISFTEADDSVRCIIEDNGIGRERSNEAKLATGQGDKHTSKGIKVSMERLRAMTGPGNRKGSLEIFDLKDESGHATGTRVEIVFPIQTISYAKSDPDR